MRVLPILFNTDMVQAILDGRKTVTRRIMKPQPIFNGKFWEMGKVACWSESTKTFRPNKCIISLYNKMPCYPGDVLYVRETFYQKAGSTLDVDGETRIVLGRLFKYAASEEKPEPSWEWVKRPSIHMPKEAARIWLKVTDVRVERLRDITNEQAMKEGFEGARCHCGGIAFACTDCYNTGWEEPPYVGFVYTWDSTIKKSDIGRYGWNANPWVWVIEFERIEKNEVYDKNI